jgi:uncharacterized membrane protein
MSRRIVHRLSYLIVVLSLTFVILPMAGARPLAEPPTAQRAVSWMEVLATWVARFFASHATAASSTAGQGTTMHTNTGSCVDPNGHPVPCNPG